MTTSRTAMLWGEGMLLAMAESHWLDGHGREAVNSRGCGSEKSLPGRC